MNELTTENTDSQQRRPELRMCAPAFRLRKKNETESLYIPQGGNSVSASGVAGIMGTSQQFRCQRHSLEEHK